MSAEMILEILHKEYFRLLHEEQYPKTPEISQKLDDLEAAIKKHKEEHGITN